MIYNDLIVFCLFSSLSEGVYTVTVTASNMLGNHTAKLPGPFYVQVPPNDLKLDQSKYSFALGLNQTFSATISEGSAVKYDWNFGDQTTLIDAGKN